MLVNRLRERGDVIEQRERKPSVQELERRRANLGQQLASHEPDGLRLFSSHRVGYLTGFAFISTERPMAVLQAWDRDPVLFVPYLEREHAGREARRGGALRARVVRSGPDR